MDNLELVSDGTGADLAGVERELRRVSDRLGHLALSRLAGPVADAVGRPRTDAGSGPVTRADAAWTVVQRLADLSAGLERGADPAPPAGREVPRLGPSVLADQLLVAGHDLLLAAAEAAADPETPGAWLDGRRTSVADVLVAAYEALVGLRRAL